MFTGQNVPDGPVYAEKSQKPGKLAEFAPVGWTLDA